ncbi:la-related protein [Anaeramoeba flamelloides]|uniref:La-related protein n=1 Tax=Anaeramoeba flamelloides TaxID=1746091 RepID=A0AAV7ZP59_9EUKA|nr:la-related protein [Anaeramoeba flamelloides]
MFGVFGLVVIPKKKQKTVVESVLRVLNVVLDPSAKSGEYVSLYLIKEKQDFLICTLRQGVMENFHADLTFYKGEEVCFRIKGNGSASAHLTICIDPPLESSESDSDLNSEEYMLYQQLAKEQGLGSSSSSEESKEKEEEEKSSDQQEDDEEMEKKKTDIVEKVIEMKKTEDSDEPDESDDSDEKEIKIKIEKEKVAPKNERKRNYQETEKGDRRNSGGKGKGRGRGKSGGRGRGDRRNSGGRGRGNRRNSGGRGRGDRRNSGGRGRGGNRRNSGGRGGRNNNFKQRRKN